MSSALPPAGGQAIVGGMVQIFPVNRSRDVQRVVSESVKGRLLVGGNRGKVGRSFLIVCNAHFIFLPF